MDRAQAENVLDAYVEVARNRSVSGKKASDSLRKVILDFMTKPERCPFEKGAEDEGNDND